MSILIQVTEEQNRQGVNSPAIPKLYGVPFISLVRDNGTSATIILDGKRENEERLVSETFAEVKVLVDSGYSDFVIFLTQTNGEPVALKASGIVEVYDNEDSKGVVIFRDPERVQDTFYIVDEDISAILALIPSASGDGNGIYDGSGTVPTTASATVTDTLDFGAGLLHIDKTNDRVGIGTLTPDYDLDVDGDVRVTDGLAVGALPSTIFRSIINVGALESWTSAHGILQNKNTGITTGYFSTSNGTKISGDTRGMLSAVTGSNPDDNIGIYVSSINPGAGNAYGILVPIDQGLNGFGTIVPTATVQIGQSGDPATFKYVDGNEGVSKVLTSDASGNATWQVGGGGGGETLAQTLALGNTTGSNDLIVTNGQSLMTDDGTVADRMAINFLDEGFGGNRIEIKQNSLTANTGVFSAGVQGSWIGMYTNSQTEFTRFLVGSVDTFSYEGATSEPLLGLTKVGSGNTGFITTSVLTTDRTYTMPDLSGTVKVGASYKIYTALVTQSGTGAPTAIILENTLSGTPVWTRTSLGNYRLTLASEFTLNKTAISPIMAKLNGTPYITNGTPNTNTNYIDYEVFNNSGDSSDDVYSNSLVEIKVYA